MKVKRVLAVVLFVMLIAGTVLAGPKEIVENHFAESFQKETDVWREWERGLKTDYGLTPDSMIFSVETLGEIEINGQPAIAMGVTFTFFCKDQHGAKKSFIRRMILGYAFDDEGAIETTYVLDGYDEIVGGWSGRIEV